MEFMSVTLETFHVDMLPLKLAPKNMLCISVTLETSHVVRSALKAETCTNMWLMLVTLETSHEDMLPLNCRAL